MLITIGDLDLWTCSVSYDSLGQSLSFEDLGYGESYWSLMLIPDGWSTGYLSGTLSIDERVEERSVCSFDVRDDSGTSHFLKGQQVWVRDWNHNVVFAGVIESVEEVLLPGTTALVHSIEVTDWHYLADKRVIAEAWEDTLAGDIVKDIIADVLTYEGVTEGTIEDGPVISECIFVYISGTEALAELAEKAGFTWWIDCDKALHFRSHLANVAPWSLTGADAMEETITISRGNPEYRNRQYIMGGLAETDPQTEEFAGDGKTATFLLGYPVKSITSVKVNDVEKTVGVRGTVGMDWYYSEQQVGLTQDSGDARLLVTDILEVVYIGFYDVIAAAEASSAVSDRAAIEGSTGYVESVVVDGSIQTVVAAEELANAKLDHFAVIGYSLVFTTQREGLTPGQLLTATLPEHDINGDGLLITAVNTREEDSYIYYDVESISGPVDDSWTAFFARMAGAKGVIAIKKSAASSGLLIQMLSFSKEWVEIDTNNIFTEVYPSASTFPGFLSSFDPDDRVRYCSLYTVAGELFRKAITSSDGMSTDTITTITLVSASEGTGDITYISWWGGVGASGVLGTGVEIDKQAHAETKDALKAWQIRKEDVKGW